MPKWTKIPNTHIEYKTEPGRMNGVQLDKYYRIRFYYGGKSYPTGMGWESQMSVKGDKLDFVKKMDAYYYSNAVAGKRPRSRKEQLEDELAASLKDDAENVTLDEYFDDIFKQMSKATPGAWRNRSNHYRFWISPICGDVLVKTLRPMHVAKVMRAVEKGKALVDNPSVKSHPRSATFEHKVWQTFKKIISHVEAIRPDLYPGQIFHGVDHRMPGPGRKRTLTDTELATLLHVIKDMDDSVYMLTLFAARTGVRFSEAAATCEYHIDLIRGVVDYTKGKSIAAARTIALPTDLLEELKKRLTGKRTKHLFPNKKGEPWKEAPETFKTAANKLKLNDGRQDNDRVTFHTLRHTFATRYSHQPGVTVADTMRQMGWSSPAMALNYDHGDEDVRAVSSQGVANEQMAAEPDLSMLEENVISIGGAR